MSIWDKTPFASTSNDSVLARMQNDELWTPTVAAMLIFDCGMLQVRGIHSVEKDSVVFSSGFELGARELRDFQNTIAKSVQGAFPGNIPRPKGFSTLALQILGHEVEYFVSQWGADIPVDSITKAAKFARLGHRAGNALDMLHLYKLGASLLWQDFEDLESQAKKNLSVLAEQSYIPTPFDVFRRNMNGSSLTAPESMMSSEIVLASSSTLSTWGTW